MKSKIHEYEWPFSFFFSVAPIIYTNIRIRSKHNVLTTFYTGTLFIINFVKFISVSAVNIHRTELYWNNNRVYNFRIDMCIVNLQLLRIILSTTDWLVTFLL